MNRMADRENITKVITELEEEIHLAEYIDETYADGVPVSLLKNALDIIKKQVPGVMTAEEAKEYLSGGDEERIPLYVEFYFKCPWGIKWTNENLMQNIKGITAWGFNEYNTQCEFGWRVWTIKPSPEQMASTPWDVLPEVRKKWELDDEIADGIGQTFSPD